MKKVLFILMLMTIGLSAQAAELMVGGVSVNLNQQVSDCTDGLTGGTYSYFPSQSKLVLNSAKIKTTGTYGIYSTVDGLTILINGENSIEAKIGFCLTGTTYMTINSGGKVTDSRTSYSLYANNSTKQPKIEIDRGTWILNNTITFGGDLIIEGGANVTVNNTSDIIISQRAMSVNAECSHGLSAKRPHNYNMRSFIPRSVVSDIGSVCACTSASSVS